MRVFLSFSQNDAEFAAKLEQALRQRRMEVWSALDFSAGEQWRQRIDQEFAQADAFIFLVGTGSLSPSLESEWRAFLRNDWESNKPLIPVLTDTAARQRVPPFLRGRKVVSTTSFRRAAEQIELLLKHPGENWIPAAYERGKADRATRLEEIKEFALALKDAASSHTRETEHR